MERVAECSTEELITFSSEPGIPDKLYYRTGEVAKLATIKPYVLRFWESEFSMLAPKKSETGHRLYRRKDVEMVLEIKRLLYEERFTIAGARQLLANSRTHKARSKKGAPPVADIQGQLFASPSALVHELRRELLDILLMLGGPALSTRASCDQDSTTPN